MAIVSQNCPRCPSATLKDRQATPAHAKSAGQLCRPPCGRLRCRHWEMTAETRGARAPNGAANEAISWPGWSRLKQAEARDGVHGCLIVFKWLLCIPPMNSIYESIRITVSSNFTRPGCCWDQIRPELRCWRPRCSGLRTLMPGWWVASLQVSSASMLHEQAHLEIDGNRISTWTLKYIEMSIDSHRQSKCSGGPSAVPKLKRTALNLDELLQSYTVYKCLQTSTDFYTIHHNSSLFISFHEVKWSITPAYFSELPKTQGQDFRSMSHWQWPQLRQPVQGGKEPHLAIAEATSDQPRGDGNGWELLTGETAMGFHDEFFMCFICFHVFLYDIYMFLTCSTCFEWFLVVARLVYWHWNISGYTRDILGLSPFFRNAGKWPTENYNKHKQQICTARATSNLFTTFLHMALCRGSWSIWKGRHWDTKTSSFCRESCAGSLCASKRRSPWSWLLHNWMLVGE